jgi:hypothetical protein
MFLSQIFSDIKKMLTRIFSASKTDLVIALKGLMLLVSLTDVKNTPEGSHYQKHFHCTKSPVTITQVK